MPTATKSFYDCKTFAERMEWIREENRKRCEAARSHKAEATVDDDGDWTLTPPGR